MRGALWKTGGIDLYETLGSDQSNASLKRPLHADGKRLTRT